MMIMVMIKSSTSLWSPQQPPLPHPFGAPSSLPTTFLANTNTNKIQSLNHHHSLPAPSTPAPFPSLHGAPFGTLPTPSPLQLPTSALSQPTVPGERRQGLCSTATSTYIICWHCILHGMRTEKSVTFHACNVFCKSLDSPALLRKIVFLSVGRRDSALKYLYALDNAEFRRLRAVHVYLVPVTCHVSCTTVDTSLWILSSSCTKIKYQY